ncbi:MAG: DUF4105 domain-containing protein [Spirochaetales bacterium]|nr:DUF4105 domain-containing protein [Spirochaetales bacterium]
MRKAVVCAILCLLAVCGLFAVSLRSGAQEVRPFDSLPMLDAYYDEGDDGNLAYWDRCTVSLLTITPGDPIYSWFGHAAILVTTPEGRRVTYDYGTFSFNDEDFFVNFAFGRLWFVCWSANADYQIADLRYEGRGARQIVLPLTAEQKKAIIGFLNTNVRAENRTYLYHHYKDNCATRLRDIINTATGGAFRLWAQEQSGISFRKQASRALSRNPFIQWGLDFLQSGRIDRKATLWDEMFLPEVLEDAVSRYFGLSSETVVEPASEKDAYLPEKPQSGILFSIAMGAVLCALGLLPLLFGRTRTYDIYSAIVEIVFGILGSLLLFMMFFTNHDVTWFNENLIFVNPLLFVMAVFALCGRKSERASVMSSRLAVAVIGVLAVLKIILPGMFVQANWPVIIPMFMFHIPGALRGVIGKNTNNR